MRRKVLLILYYWPPAGGPGVQRWLYFVRYLREFGMEPVLYLPQKPHYPILDSSLEALIPPDLTVYRSSFWEPYQLASFFGSRKTKRLSSGIIHGKRSGLIERLLLWIRGNLFIPDARCGWIKPALKELPKILKVEQIDTVITSGPPHSLHLIGLKLKARLPVRWVADFRDPWTDIGYMDSLQLSSWAQRKHIRLEALVLNNADVIITTSNHTRKAFQQMSPKPIHVVTNGFDSELGSGEQPSGKFVLAHIGTLLSDRNPEGLWLALSALCAKSAAFKSDLCLQFTGNISEEVMQRLAHYNLEDNTVIRSYVPHSEALRLQREAQVLLLLEIDAPKTIGILPGKVFEYMAAARPILAIGPADWEAAELVEELHCGKGFTNAEPEQLQDQIWSWYMAYKSDKLVIKPESVATYTRRNLTERLVKEVLWG